MSWTVNFLIRIVLAAAFFAVGVMVASKWWNRLGLKAAIAYYIVRIAVMVAAVEALGIVPYDVSGWHLHAGWMVEEGMFPGRDFLTPYHLGFNGLLALCETVWRSPASIVILFSLCEALAMRLLYKVTDKLLGTQTAKRGAILYLTSPICLMQSTLSAQDETLFTLFLATFLYFTFVAESAKGRSLVSVLTVFCTKLLAPFYMFPFLLLKRWKAMTVFVAAMMGYLVAAWLAGLHPLLLRFGRQPGLDAPADEIVSIATFGNIPTLLPGVPEMIWTALLLASLSVTFFAGARSLFGETDPARRLRSSTLLLFSLLLEFMLLNRMTYSYYLIPVFPLLCLFAQDESTLPRRWRPVAVAWLFLFAFKDMFHAGCEFHGFMEGCIWGRAFVSALCVAVSGALLFLHFVLEKCRARG